MRQTATLLFCFAGAIWLSGQVFAQDAAQAEAARKKAELIHALRNEMLLKALVDAEAKAAQDEIQILREKADQRIGRVIQEKAIQERAKLLEDARLAQEAALVQQVNQQFGPQFRQLYRTELHFMRSVCQPTKQQYEKIAAESEATLKEAITKFSVMMRGGRVGDQSDPRAPVADMIAKLVRANLSPEQAELYQKELDQRAAARRQVVVLYLVARLDRLLILTPEQRDQLRQILENNWDNSWNQLQMLQYSGPNFPALPNAKIVPLLTEAQKTVWLGTPKANIRFGFDLGLLQGIEIEDEVWIDQ